MPKRLNITNYRFGMLVAIRATANRDSRGYILWLCRCNCGKTKLASTTCLQKGSTQSCGCRKGDPTHGHTRNGKMHPLYRTWRTMRSRCDNPNVKEYKIYGARGIKVCKRWERFENFLADVGERPPGRIMDRIDNDKGYFPGNFRWATHSLSNKNRRPYKHRKKNFAWMRRSRGLDGRFL